MNAAVCKKLLPANPRSGVEFPVRVKGLFRPHYMTWSEQQQIEFQAPQHLKNVLRIITETGLQVYKESEQNADGHQKTFKTVWRTTLRRAGVRSFRIYDLWSTYATRLSAGGVADEWV